MQREKNRIIAYGGISSALAVVLVFAASVLPTGKLVCMFAAGLCPLVLLSKHKVAGAAASAAAAGGLMLVLIPNLAYGLSYVLMFGLYPFIRYACRRFKSKTSEVLVLCVITFIVLLLGLFLAQAIFSVTLPFAPWIAIVLLLPISVGVVFLEDFLSVLFLRLLVKVL